MDVWVEWTCGSNGRVGRVGYGMILLNKEGVIDGACTKIRFGQNRVPTNLTWAELNLR